MNKLNDVFYVCSLIEYIARKTNNTKKYIVNNLGKDTINKIYNLASIYHTENIEKISDELINQNNITNGNYNIFNIISNSNPPSYFDIGKVYERLVRDISKNEDEYVDKLIEVMTSWIIEELDNYDSSLYYESPNYLYNCYICGKIL